MDGRESIRLADSMVAGPSEAHWHSAVSRAYYAAFHVSRDLFVDCGFTVPRGDQAHTYLWRRLSNAGHSDVRDSGNNLQTVRRQRNRADYDLDRPFEKSAASGQIGVCKEIIRRLEAAAKEPIKSQITEAMKDYERDVLKEVTWRP